MEKIVVFSAINVTGGGPMTILKTFIDFFCCNFSSHKLYVLVKDESMFSLYSSNIRFIEFKNSQRSVVHKLYYEYFYFAKLSKQLKPYLWLSLNDCSPVVTSSVQAVYIHNATALYRLSLLDFRFPSRVMLQRFYYKFFLRFNLHSNRFVIVQQAHMKDYLVKKLGFKKQIIINRPTTIISDLVDRDTSNGLEDEEYLIYPTKPDVYKNLHFLVKAFSLGVDRGFFGNLKLVLTITGTENRYSRYVKRLSKRNAQILFIGPQQHDVMLRLIEKSKAVIFPSKLETWGLPLSEGMAFNKYVLAADLPYAHETLLEYEKKIFFDPDDVGSVLETIKEVMKIDTSLLQENTLSKDKNSLPQLFSILLNEPEK